MSNLSFFFSVLDFSLRFSKKAVKCQSSKHKHNTNPLASDQRIAKQQHRAQDGEELSRCGDNGTRQRTKVCHRHENEILKRKDTVCVSGCFITGSFTQVKGSDYLIVISGSNCYQ